MLKVVFFFIVLLNTLATVKVLKDNRYLFDNEKTKLVLIVWLVPLFGALYSLNRVGFSWLGTMASTFVPLNKPLKATSIFAFFAGYNLSSKFSDSDIDTDE